MTGIYRFNKPSFNADVPVRIKVRRPPVCNEPLYLTECELRLANVNAGQRLAFIMVT